MFCRITLKFRWWHPLVNKLVICGPLLSPCIKSSMTTRFLKPCSHKMLIIFNWITIQSIILHSILFNYGSVHICENSNKLGRITSQSKVENKMAPYRTAVMIWRPEERQIKLRRLEEEKYAVWNSNNGWVSSRIPSIGHFLAYFVPYKFLVVHGV